MLSMAFKSYELVLRIWCGSDSTLELEKTAVAIKSHSHFIDVQVQVR